MTENTDNTKDTTPEDKNRSETEAEKIDLITEKMKKYQETKLEMFQKSRQAILEQQKADLEFCKDLDDFFKSILTRPSGQR